MKNTFRATLIASAIAAFPLGAGAAGLGAVNVFSGLGQPLRAEIELNATPQELESLVARVAGAEAFRQANFSYSPVMSGVRLSVERRGEKAFVRVTSDRPVNDPFLDLVVEMTWASGRVLREYTFLLDPVDMARPAPRAAAPVQAARPSANATPPTRPAPAAAVVPDQYTVARGDTLRSIASRFRQPDTNLDQMLIALLRANPDAFDGGNVNRLRAGAILNIPDSVSASAVDATAARRELVAQAADFNAYRNRVAGAVKAAPATDTSAPSRESAGAVVPRVEEPGKAQPADRVEVSGGAGGASGDGERLARLQSLEEELFAREKALQEANAKLTELEAVVRDLQQLVELRNQSLAQLQQQAAPQASAPTAAAVPTAAPSPAATAQPAQTVAAATPSTADDARLPDIKAELERDTAAAVAEPAAAPATPAPTVAAPAESIPEKPKAPQEAKPAKKPTKAAEPPPPEPSFVESLLGDPLVLAGGGGVLALLLGYGAFRMRQRSRSSDGDSSLSGLSEDQSGEHSVFGVKGGQSVDTGASSVLHTDFSQSGLSAIDADEGVDPVAEADVYMAYGRDAQAEEILLDALKADANRPAIYLKLLEVYAARPDAKHFEAVATDFYSRTGGSGDEWRKAAEMGRKIDPENPLYADRSPARGDEPPFTEPPSDPGPVSAALASGAAAALAAAAAEATPKEADVSLADLDFSPSQPPVEPSASQLKATWTVPGDLRQITDAVEHGEASRAPATELPASIEDELMPSDLSELDFDLDATPVVSVEDVPAKPDFEASSGLTFDLDIAVPEPAAPTAEAAEPARDISMDRTVVGDEIDLGFAAATGSEFPSVDDAAPGSGFVTRTSSGDGVSTDEDKSMQATLLQTQFSPGGEDGEVDLEKTGFDNSLLDFDFDLDSAASAPVADVKPLDLSNIDLDLELPEPVANLPEDIVPSIETPAIDTPILEEFQSVLPDAKQEVDTKLDLARAYEEMGDKEGARELIEEVLREGSPEQVAKANALLAQIG